MLPTITAGMHITLQGITFRVTQVIAASGVVYLENRKPSGRWSGFDRRGDMQALQSAILDGAAVVEAGRVRTLKIA